MNANLYTLFASRFPADPAATLLETEEGSLYTYRAMADLTARMANALEARGVRPGDRVAAQVEKSPEALALYLACLRAGYVYLPLNTAYQPAEIEYFLGDATPAVFVCRPEAQADLSATASRAGVRETLTLGLGGLQTHSSTPSAVAVDGDILFRTADGAGAGTPVLAAPQDEQPLVVTAAALGLRLDLTAAALHVGPESYVGRLGLLYDTEDIGVTALHTTRLGSLPFALDLTADPAAAVVLPLAPTGRVFLNPELRRRDQVFGAAATPNELLPGLEARGARLAIVSHIRPSTGLALMPPSPFLRPPPPTSACWRRHFPACT